MQLELLKETMVDRLTFELWLVAGLPSVLRKDRIINRFLGRGCWRRNCWATEGQAMGASIVA